MTKGKLTGVGVGPGDPELLTLKAVRKIRESDVVVLPVSDRGLEVPVFSGENEREEDGLNNYRNKCVAYQIVKKAVPQVKEKLKMYLPVPMIKERDRLEKIHDMDASVVCELLEEGKNLVFLTIGDPSIYSTYMYLHKRILKMGYEAEMVPGIPSFVRLHRESMIHWQRKKNSFILFRLLMGLGKLWNFQERRYL